MITLFLDLDNTLIYSKRRLESLDGMRLVEMYNGEPLSYMPQSAYNKLLELHENKNVQIIPITTRVFYQYDRIELPIFKYALLGNGSLLLVDGNVDTEWKAESDKYTNVCHIELEKALRRMLTIGAEGDTARVCDNMFVYGKFADPISVYCNMLGCVDTEMVNVFAQGKKVYVLPKEFDKGFTIKRFCERFQTGKIVSAGDEVLDFSMADYSEVFITSNDKCNKDNKILSKSAIFADDILDYVSSMS